MACFAARTALSKTVGAMLDPLCARLADAGRMLTGEAGGGDVMARSTARAGWPGLDLCGLGVGLGCWSI